MVRRAILRAMRVPLERDGSKVLAADDGPSGLSLVRRESFDLVLLNVMSSGLDVCREMRQFSDVPLIMFGSPKPDDVVSALAAGADDYVLHPSNQHELLARVHAVVRRAAWQRRNLAQAVPGKNSQQTLSTFSRDSQPSVLS